MAYVFGFALLLALGFLLYVQAERRGEHQPRRPPRRDPQLEALEEERRRLREALERKREQSRRDVSLAFDRGRRGGRKRRRGG